jgi:hypothetical protein
MTDQFVVKEGQDWGTIMASGNHIRIWRENIVATHGLGSGYLGSVVLILILRNLCDQFLQQ